MYSFHHPVGLVFFFVLKPCLSFVTHQSRDSGRVPTHFHIYRYSLPAWCCLGLISLQLAAEFGNIFSVHWGRDKVVVVSGYKLAKEALVTQGDCFLDRNISPLFDKVFKGNGLSTSNGYKWRRQRHFSINHLKNFGEGKRTLELHIQLESNFLCQAFQQEEGTSRCVCSLLCPLLKQGRRGGYADDRPRMLYDALPWLFQYLSGPHEIIYSNYGMLTSFLKRQIEKHKRDWDPFNHRDFIDKKNDAEAGFNIENLVICTLDLFEAGTETMTTTLRWLLLYMMKYPEIQEKVQEEIDRVIGQSRQPCLSDRANMPYTEAVIHETQRLRSILPLNVPRLCNKDTYVGGYFIPQGTTLLVNLSSVLHDWTMWETPHRFNPQHFLDENGCFRKREAFYPFSVGRRMCLGEQLARMELFLFFTALLQRFSISPVPGQEVSFDTQGNVILGPKPFHICVKDR
uniref:Uncharacterized protein n=1 Tax=Myripristis murdjan TaxID=586833 RepID=A0A667Z2R1_9TELE